MNTPIALPLSDPRATQVDLCGTKAARLAALRQAGHPVPDGVVVTAPALASLVAGLESPNEASIRALAIDSALSEAIARACEQLAGPVAVRSSGIAEDLVGASFAGQYETLLDVEGASAVEVALLDCLASAYSERTRTYRDQRGLAGASMAVLIQRMVPARAAGVAFTAHPVTGEREIVVISAVAGLGEQLVSGAANAEDWEVRGDQARGAGAVLSATDAVAVAELANRVAGGDPTDIEWAFADDRLFLLQARPMTALPEPITWAPPLPGIWLRNFRLGEWIGAPLTPLSESWLISGIEERVHGDLERMFGLQARRPLHVVVNGWYFYGGMNFPSGWEMLRGLPRMLWTLVTRFHEVAALTPPIAHLGFTRETERWRTKVEPACEANLERLEAEFAAADLNGLRAIIDGAITDAADRLRSIIGVAGYAAKAEFKLLEFWLEHLREAEGTIFDLVAGAEVRPAAHDVEGLDWVFPTLGERGRLPDPPDAETRRRVLERRDAAEASARAALPANQRVKFDRLVAEARRAHPVRQAQTAVFTRAWPLMRRALAKIGEQLVARGVLVDATDVVFLTRAELDAAIDGGELPVPIAERRATWERQRNLTPPLQLGVMSGFLKAEWDKLEANLRHAEHDSSDALGGQPGSPGRVTGLARVIRSLDDLDRLLPGEILVAPITTPGWTPAFARAAAIVTDTGSVASHASIVAREYGIPAVVATGCGTSRIVDGQRITVDGGRGVVRLAG